MDQAALVTFFERLVTSAELRAEFAELAARHGIDVTGGELSGQELGAVSGGTVVATAQAGASASDLAGSTQMQLLQAQAEAAAKTSAELNAIKKSLITGWGSSSF
jgi:hypothetical protein